jgi:hypothetical protein
MPKHIESRKTTVNGNSSEFFIMTDIYSLT